ncbi:RadC family protein [Niabella drilacis]|uniref:DNA repair protein RadC n=1 Tax=Niabella drilacis (strain DSM 25811 / CCM 8410 / CCUG 62505 / LMG 26954 / E90) TaxID=1285928 RepID=A0A1G6V369_NIADE|nr:DNA repair protein RadC [Niabella drilacis]SDD48069.1 DNA repair protein RadC [Niabella drilacis]
MENTSTIRNWAKDDQPREKLIARGAHSLSNSELLAILIHNGTPNRSALHIAKEVLKLGNDNLNELGKHTIADFTKIKGIGEAKAVAISAALELGRRRHAGVLLQRPLLNTSKQIGEYLRTRLKDLLREVFAVIFLNQSNVAIHFEVVSEGGITGTVADPRVILKKALEKNAVGIILAHNHPSGNLSPSKADEFLTQKIREAAKFLDIRVMDHIIVGDEGYYSFADEGLFG